MSDLYIYLKNPLKLLILIVYYIFVIISPTIFYQGLWIS